MRAELLNPSDYLKAAEFGQNFDREPTFTILSAGMEELVDTNGKKKTKGVIRFKETSKGLVSNVVNVNCLIAMFGSETDGWKGKRITLYEDPNVESFGEIVSGIRVRGSPDLERGKTVKMKLKGKGTVTVELRKTGTAAPKAAEKPKGVDAGVEVIFSKLPSYRLKLSELTVEQLREVMAAAQEASRAPSLSTEQLASLDRQAQAVEKLLAAAAAEGVPAVEPGAAG